MVCIIYNFFICAIVGINCRFVVNLNHGINIIFTWVYVDHNFNNTLNPSRSLAYCVVVLEWQTQVAHEQEIPQQRHQHSLESLRNMQMNEFLLQRKMQQQHQQLLGQQRLKEIEMDHRAYDPCSRQPDIMSINTNQVVTVKSLAGQSRYLYGLFHFSLFRFTSLAGNSSGFNLIFYFFFIRNSRHSTPAGYSYLDPLISEGVTNTPLEGWPLNVSSPNLFWS